MNPRAPFLIAALLLGGCSGGPKLTPWQATALLPALPASCATGREPDPASVPAAAGPGGLSVVSSGGRAVVLAAMRGCVMAIDTATGAAEPLPTRGDSIAPTMVHASSEGVAFSSSLSGSVRTIDAEGAVRFNVSALRSPLGVLSMPGGSAMVAENGQGRVLRLGPGQDSRPRVLIDGLEGPVGLAVTSATTAYVSEAAAGRITRFRLDRFEKAVVAEGLARPEGIALMADGRLAVVEVGLRRLVAISLDSGRLETLADDLPVGTTGADGVSDPQAVNDVAAGADGTLYIGANSQSTVMRVTPRPAAGGN